MTLDDLHPLVVTASDCERAFLESVLYLAAGAGESAAPIAAAQTRLIQPERATQLFLQLVAVIGHFRAVEDLKRSLRIATAGDKNTAAWAHKADKNLSLATPFAAEYGSGGESVACKLCGGDGGGENCPRCGGSGFEST